MFEIWKTKSIKWEQNRIQVLYELIFYAFNINPAELFDISILYIPCIRYRAAYGWSKQFDIFNSLQSLITARKTNKEAGQAGSESLQHFWQKAPGIVSRRLFPKFNYFVEVKFC